MGELFGPPKDPVALPDQFTSTTPEQALRDFIHTQPELVSRRGERYIHTPIVGACVKCKLTGSIDLPVNFDYRTGDNLLAGRIIKVYCPKCRKETEFRALTPEELNEDQFYVMRRYYEIYKVEQVAGRLIPAEIVEFLSAFEKRALEIGARKKAGAAAPAAPPEPPKIILP